MKWYGLLKKLSIIIYTLNKLYMSKFDVSYIIIARACSLLCYAGKFINYSNPLWVFRQISKIEMKNNWTFWCYFNHELNVIYVKHLYAACSPAYCILRIRKINYLFKSLGGIGYKWKNQTKNHWTFRVFNHENNDYINLIIYHDSLKNRSIILSTLVLLKKKSTLTTWMSIFRWLHTLSGSLLKLEIFQISLVSGRYFFPRSTLYSYIPESDTERHGRIVRFSTRANVSICTHVHTGYIVLELCLWVLPRGETMARKFTDD